MDPEEDLAHSALCLKKIPSFLEGIQGSFCRIISANCGKERQNGVIRPWGSRWLWQATTPVEIWQERPTAAAALADAQGLQGPLDAIWDGGVTRLVGLSG